MFYIFCNDYCFKLWFSNLKSLRRVPGCNSRAGEVVILSLPDFTGQRRYHWQILWLGQQSRNGSPVSYRRQTQGLHRSWKTWKVMEFKNFILQA